MPEPQLSDSMAAVIAQFRQRRAAGSHGPALSLLERRNDFSPAPTRYPLPVDVTIEAASADDVECWWLTPNGADPHRTVVFLHGGGWALGDLASHGELAARIGREAEARVLFPIYRRAPENPFPAAVDDVLAAWSWVHRTLRDAGDRVALVGDSAGGNLALALTVTERDRSGPLPGRLGLMSPVTDLTGSGPSMDERADQDVVFEPDTVRVLERQYLAGADPHLPAASPLFADLTGLPPMLIQTGDAEVLYSDSERLADAARQAGVDVTLRVGAGLPHVYPAMADTPEAQAASQEMGRFLFR